MSEWLKEHAWEEAGQRSQHTEAALEITPKDRQFRFHAAHYLDVLRHTDIPGTAELLADTARVYREVPDRLRSAKPCPSLEARRR